MQLRAFQIDFSEYPAYAFFLASVENPFSAKILDFLSTENDNV
jgi:hypothetical protein